MSHYQTKHSFLSAYFRGETITGSWQIITKTLSVISAFLIISNLDIFKYGTYVLLFAFFSLVAALFLRPLEDVVVNDVVRYIADGREDKAKRLYLENTSIRSLTAIILSVSLFFGAEIVAEYYGEDISALLRILSALFVISVFSTSMRILFRVRLNFGPPASRPIIYEILYASSLFTLIYFDIFTINNILISHTIATLLSNVALISSFLKEYRVWTTVSAYKQTLIIPIVKGYGKWALYSHLLSSLTGNLRPWLIKFFINTEAVAIFSVAESLFGALKTFLPVTTLNTLLPRELSDQKRMTKILLRGTKYLIIVSFVLGFAGFIFVPPLVERFIPHYTSSIILFHILLLSFPFICLRSMGTTVLLALRRQRYLFFLTIVKIVLGILFPVILLYLFGITGMALERALFASIIAFLVFVYLFTYEVPLSSWKMLVFFDKEDLLFIKMVVARLHGKLKKLLAYGYGGGNVT